MADFISIAYAITVTAGGLLGYVRAGWFISYIIISLKIKINVLTSWSVLLCHFRFTPFKTLTWNFKVQAQLIPPVHSTTKSKWSWLGRRNRLPISISMGSNVDLPHSTLSLTILAWLILFHFQFEWIFTSLFFFILPQNVWHFYTLKWLVRCYFHGASLAFPIQHVFVFLFHCLIFFNQLHATFLQLHIFIVWSLCAVSTGIVNKYIYETCGCEPLTVIFQSSEISNFVDLGEK